jgi:uncharacterized membrane protein
MTVELRTIEEQRATAERRSSKTGTLLPLACSGLISGLWVTLAFVHTTNFFVRALSVTFASLLFALGYASVPAIASVWAKRTTNIYTLRLQLARCSLASIIFALYLPEYVARVQPPMLRSFFLLAIVGGLWLCLSANVISQQRNIRVKKNTVNIIGAGIVVLLFAIVTWLAIRKYMVFGYVGQDLAYFAQILHTTLHGHLFWGNLLQDVLYTKPVSTDFAGHNSPVMFLFLPFYAVFSSPITLIVLRNIAIFACVIPIFLLARLRTSSPVAWVWALAFLATPTILYQTTFDFYPLSFAALPILCAIYFYATKQYPAFCIALASSLLIREDLVFFVFGMGLLALVHRRRMPWFATPLIGAMVWAIISFLIIIPTSLHGASFVTDACFYHLGTTRAQMIHSVVFHPTQNVLLHNNIVYLKTLLTPAGLLFPAGSLVALLSLPYLAINLLAGGGPCITNVIYAQYSLVPATLLFASSLLVLTRRFPTTLGRLGNLGLRGNLPAALLIFTLAVAGIIFTTDREQIDEFHQAVWVNEARHVLSLIPVDSSVAAPRYMLPHLANRDCLYQTHRLQQYHTPVYEYLILDTNWSNINASSVYQTSYEALLANSAINPNLQLIYESPRYRVYRNAHEHGVSCFNITSSDGTLRHE